MFVRGFTIASCDYAINDLALPGTYKLNVVFIKVCSIRYLVFIKV